MNVVEKYNKGKYTFILTPKETLVRTNLQVFLLLSPQYPRQLRVIREEIQGGRIDDINQLCGLFYNEWGEPIVSMRAVREEWYV